MCWKGWGCTSCLRKNVAHAPLPFGFILLPLPHSMPVSLGMSAALTLYHFEVFWIKPDPLSVAVFPMHKVTGNQLKNQEFTQTNLSLGRRASPECVIHMLLHRAFQSWMLKFKAPPFLLYFFCLHWLQGKPKEEHRSLPVAPCLWEQHHILLYANRMLIKSFCSNKLNFLWEKKNHRTQKEFCMPLVLQLNYCYSNN